MIYNIGTDLVSIDRITEIYNKFGNKFAKKILSPKELGIFNSKKQKIHYLAKRFAAKEAISKTLKTGIGKISFHDISILNYNNGEPYVKCSPSLDKVTTKCCNSHNYKIHITLTDDNNFAMAFSVLEILK